METITHPVLEQAHRLAQHLQATEEIQRFRQAEAQVNTSSKVNDYIQTIKKKQKELVHAKHYQKPNYTRLLEEELARLQQEFDQLPIVSEYQQSQVEANDLLQTIQQVIVNTVSQKIHVETGGTAGGGCGGGCGSGGACGCS